MSSSIRAFSAPGKAFLAGGYLVLEPTYNAYVTALSSRMHAVIKSKVSDAQTSSIIIKSPQFQFGEWEYKIDNENPVKIPKEVKNHHNPFLEATVFTVLSYIGQHENVNIEITIFSDPGYHSQDEGVPKKSSKGSKQFLFHDRQINEVAKTGMGSSAGLVAVVTTALISAFRKEEKIVDLLNIIHNCSQIAHCYAQKKIGSGFDVATAVYGSIIYRRFDPKLINDLFEHEFFETQDDQELSKSYADMLRVLVESNWEFNHSRCALPPGIKLLMGDIKGGSETPKLVSKVLKWKNENMKESSELYHDLNKSNLDFIEALSHLHDLYKQNPEAYIETLSYFQKESVSSIGSARLDILSKLSPFLALVESIKKIRFNLRKLTKCCGADIEPPLQTTLLDNCNNINGCLGGVVPGAGGYDAICLLIVENSIHEFIKSSDGNKNFSNVAWLNLHEEDDGIIEEDVNEYSGL